MFYFITLSAQALPINEIRIEGATVSIDQIQTLKNISGFLPGDEFDALKNERALPKLQEYFQNKGYPNTKVTEVFEKNSKTGKNNLIYRFNLGEAQRLSHVEVVSKTSVISTELQKKLMEVVEVKPDELLDRDRLKDLRRSIEVLLLAQNFIDSKVVDIQTQLLRPSVFKAVFTVDLGQRVVFSVSGNEHFSRNELASIIDEQRQVGLGRDYVSVLINKLNDFYVDHGFRKVKIFPYTFESNKNEPRKVVFEISEGPRVWIHRVIFEGQETLPSRVLENIFFDNANERIQAKIYNQSMVEQAAQRVVEELKRRGYLSSKMIAIKTEDFPPHDVNVRIFINEGVQTTIQSIDFSGNSVFASEQLKYFTGLKEEQPLSLAKLEEGLESVKREYRNLGYLDVKIANENSGALATYSERNQFAFLDIEISEGAQWFYSGLKIFGTEKTESVVIEREIQLKFDEPISEKKLLETEDRLRRLGLFSQVTIELIPSDQGEKYRDLKVSVSEAIPGNMGIGAGFRNDLGFRLFGEITYGNFWGLNHSFVFNASSNYRLSGFRFIEVSAQAGYIWPWFVLGETTFRPNVSAERRQYRAFDAETYAFSASFERMLLKSPKLSGSLTYTLEQIRQFNAVDTTQNQSIRIGSITPQLKLDLRDHPLTPRKGFYASTSFEYANSILGSQTVKPPVNYGRFQARADVYLDFIPRVVWYSSVRGGWLKNFAHTYDQGSEFSIPLIKQFALGGVSSMRGYLEQEMNVQATDRARRVQNFMTFINYRTQFDFYTTQNLSFGPFMDAGNLNVDKFTLGALEYGAGLGMRYLTPVGPVNFDWGFKLFPKNTAETNVFYFSLGVN
jgi:outer membrane protein insertion porin family